MASTITPEMLEQSHRVVPVILEESHRAVHERLEQSYRENVETLERLQSSKVFKNGMPLHAAIIFESFLRHATKSVRIYCKTLAKQVFDEPWLLEAAIKAVDRGVCLSVVVKDPADASAFSTWLKQMQGHPAVVFFDNVYPFGHKRTKFNFATMDGRAYRFEPDESVCEAYACMNNRETASLLDDFFDRVTP